MLPPYAAFEHTSQICGRAYLNVTNYSMGLDSDCIQFLSTAAKRGSPLGATLTVGRQELSDGVRIARSYNLRAPAGDPGRFAEWALRGIGATSVSSVDASAYEGADLVHDLNAPLPAAHHEQYDSVIDGGTLEHVFDVRQSLTTLMQLVRVGGSVFLITPANNQMGHGFYQFSPELFFRAFASQSGFEVRRMVLQPYTFLRRAYEVADPAAIGERVALINRAPVRLFVHAVRTRKSPIFADAPQQSDYSASWERGTRRSGPVNSLTRRVYHSVVTSLPPRMRDAVYGAYFAQTKYTLRNRRFFTPTTL